MADETIFRIKERIRQEMRDLLGVTMADGGAIDRQALPAQIDGVAHEVCADFGISDENWIGYIIKSTIDDFIGLGPLQPLQDDPKVAEIFIDPVGVEPNGTFITPVARAEVDGQIVDCPGIDLVSHDEVGRLIGRIAEEANRRCDDSFPEMDATLADGSRVHAAHPKVSPNGWSLNIRKFSKDKLTAEDLLERGAMSEPMYMFLKSAVKARANFIISGGTGSGKTTMLNALSAFIGYNERVVTIEDTRELQLKQRIVIPRVACPPNSEGKGEFTMHELLVGALRERPDRIVVGECRDDETYEMLQAMQTGHDGSLTTIHANDCAGAFTRIENMILKSQGNMTMEAIRRQIGAAIDVVVQVNKKARQINGLVNEWYLEDMSENIKSSLDDLRRKGHHIGAWVRYGYMKDPNQKGHIIPDPVAAAVVERIFKMYLEGNSRADIARILNSEQIPPPGLYKIQQGDKYKNAFMAGEWDSCSISRILKEEMYIGNMVQGRQASESYKTKKLRTLPKEDWIRVIGTHEAIISLETWNQTQALLAVGARSFTRSEEIGLFSRKVYCGHCNKLMRTGRSKRKSGTYYNYVICVRRHPEINPCPVHAVSNALMEKTILDQLDILAAKYKDGSLFSEIMDEESTIGIEIKRLKAELAQHKKKLVEYESGLKCLYLDKASGSISNSDYQFLSRELSAGKELAERKVDLCTENYNKILRSQEILREKAGVLESYSRPKELTRSMVETFIDHIVICSSSDGTSKQEIKIYWNF